jgi:dUTP pyrophosphatase
LRANLVDGNPITIQPLKRAIVPTGLYFQIPLNFELQVRPRSGLAYKNGITVLNTPGTVDSGYNGEVKVILYNSTENTIQIKKGQKVAQACVCPVVNGKGLNPLEVSSLDEKDRGNNGFGSTGI